MDALHPVLHEVTSVDEPPGELVAVHWGWAADRLTPAEAATLLDVTSRNLAAAQLP